MSKGADVCMYLTASGTCRVERVTEASFCVRIIVVGIWNSCAVTAMPGGIHDTLTHKILRARGILERARSDLRSTSPDYSTSDSDTCNLEGCL